jgi:hypothetical protein
MMIVKYDNILQGWLLSAAIQMKEAVEQVRKLEIIVFSTYVYRCFRLPNASSDGF